MLSRVNPSSQLLVERALADDATGRGSRTVALPPHAVEAVIVVVEPEREYAGRAVHIERCSDLAWVGRRLLSVKRHAAGDADDRGAGLLASHFTDERGRTTRSDDVP